jgi:hypothetical protein
MIKKRGCSFSDCEPSELSSVFSVSYLPQTEQNQLGRAEILLERSDGKSLCPAF